MDGIVPQTYPTCVAYYVWMFLFSSDLCKSLCKLYNYISLFCSVDNKVDNPVLEATKVLLPMVVNGLLPQMVSVLQTVKVPRMASIPLIVKLLEVLMV